MANPNLLTDIMSGMVEMAANPVIRSTDVVQNNTNGHTDDQQKRLSDGSEHHDHTYTVSVAGGEGRKRTSTSSSETEPPQQEPVAKRQKPAVSDKPKPNANDKQQADKNKKTDDPSKTKNSSKSSSSSRSSGSSSNSGISADIKSMKNSIAKLMQSVSTMAATVKTNSLAITSSEKKLQEMLEYEYEEPHESAHQMSDCEEGECSDTEQGHPASSGDSEAVRSEDTPGSSESCDLLDNFAKQFKMNVKEAPPINEKLAEVVDQMLSNGVDYESLAEKAKKYSQPKNVKMLNVTQVETPLWDAVFKETRSADIKLHRIQGNMIKALMPLY